MIVAFIDTHREVVVEGRKLGVEPICRVLSEHGLQIAPSTYYATKNRPPSARAQRDAALGPVLRGLWEDNYRVYGAQETLESGPPRRHRYWSGPGRAADAR